MSEEKNSYRKAEGQNDCKGACRQGLSDAVFPPTLWPLVLDCGSGMDAALESLCRSYWPPIYTYYRHRGLDTHHAQELTQGFFMHILQRNRLATVSPEKGRFRSWLLVCAKNYLRNDERNSRPLDASGQPILFTSIELEHEEKRCESWLARAEEPELIYDAMMAKTVVNEARAKLRKEYQRCGKEELFGALEPHLNENTNPYLELATQLNRTVESVRVEVHRMRRRFGDLLRAEVAHLVSSKEEAEDELRHLLTAWARLGK